MTLIDTSVLYAAFDRRDAHHTKAYEFFRNAEGVYVTTWPIITETAHLLRGHQAVQFRFLEWIEAGAIRLVDLTRTDLQRSVEVMKKYADLPADFADATLVAIAERLAIDQVATFDSDFDVYRLADGRPLRRLTRT